MNLLFASPSLLVSANKAEYDRMIDEAGGNIAVAERRLFDSVDVEVKEVDLRAGNINHLSVDEKGAAQYSEDKVSSSEQSRV
jgi:hypothetical protein